VSAVDRSPGEVSEVTRWRALTGYGEGSWLRAYAAESSDASTENDARGVAFPSAPGTTGGATSQDDDGPEGDGCAPFSFTPTIDGSLSDWQAGPAGTALSAFRGGTGYLAYDAANYYFACNMAPVGSKGFAVTIYVGDGASATGGTTTLLPQDTCTASTNALPEGTNAEYAFTTDLVTGAVTAYAWNAATAAWAPEAFTGKAASTPDVELSVPKSDVGNIAAPNVVGALVQNVGVTDCSTAEFAGAVDGWPGTNGIYVHYAVANTASCAAPNATLRP
jgi:hypothetical protein